MLSEAQEDYLKQIFLLGEGEPVSTTALAERLGVRPASVTGMLQKLAALGLVDYRPYQGARLTEAGRKIAIELLRHHRLIETFLAEALGFDWHEVHDEAERLEHVISERLEARLAEWLGHPERDPHGDPIPTPELTFPAIEPGRPLPMLPVGAVARIVRVRAQDPDTLNLLARLSLRPGTRVHVLEHTASGVRLAVGDERFLLPRELAEAIWAVEEVSS
ncbi:metal-dependent transcriptional regulator [Rhodothermus marinus]|uniref:metal-dependent transcriptional regulator n=1 Tax=Rhodothermus marinus TaxID=29549 RepID=UPI000223D668|nr:metal-dependent transcriptional regulator [Rhodothermus marinus]AEN73250.1 iron (metal) dependent repressor, DtxR family [Rhodothermus marinus SG0.5JP17-172]MBO2491456.1 metal-dependent transcriptional regulator [Rhodothermus marinus]